MVEIGSKYEENKSMLVEKLNDSETIDLVIVEMTAENHRCYFCSRSIPQGDKMFEVTHYHVIKSHEVDSTYYVDEICMGLARSGNNKNSSRV